jgi:hypothetical protein
MGKSRHIPWSADFSGQEWCTTVEECVVHRALGRIRNLSWRTIGVNLIPHDMALPDGKVNPSILGLLSLFCE